MAKVTLQDIGNLQNEPSALSALNGNFTAIEEAIENTLSRDGATPNEMNANLDMNSNRIQNLPLPVGPTEPIRKGEYDTQLGAIETNVILTQGYRDEAAIAATSAAASATAATTAKTQAETAYGAIKSWWLGAQASDPTTNLDGGPLAEGMLYYNSTANEPRFYNGSLWQAFPNNNALQRFQSYIATPSQTVFTVAGGYSPGFAQVYYNGVLLTNGIDVDVSSGTQFVLSSGATAGSELTFIAFQTFTVANVLVPANNLSDVVNPSTARSNLGLGSLATKNSVAITDLPVGTVVAHGYAEYTANANLTAIPWDDTIPQWTEGTLIAEVTITPKSVTDKVLIEFEAEGTTDTAGTALMAALFVNGAANPNAVRARGVSVPNANNMVPLTLRYEHVPGVTTPVTYSIRAGGSSGATVGRLNGQPSARYFGGAQAATLKVTEFKA